MTRRRALVVRSGANPFVSLGTSTRIEIVEKVSHSIEPRDPPPGVLQAAADYLVFTSQVAVERALGDSPLAPAFRKIAAGAQVLAVGSATGTALEARDVAADLVAGGSAESILERLPARLDGRRVVLPCGEDAAMDLPERLRSRGGRVLRIVLYRKVPKPRDPELEREIVDYPFAAFSTTSPSAAQWLFAGLSPDAARRLRETPAVVLGRFTRRFLESHGVTKIRVTEEARFSDALAALEELASAPRGT